MNLYSILDAAHLALIEVCVLGGLWMFIASVPTIIKSVVKFTYDEIISNNNVILITGIVIFFMLFIINIVVGYFVLGKGF